MVIGPEGVKWARELFRRLAAEGRTVFVSSHLMSEMEQIADHLVVIGRGELIAAESLARFAARGARQTVMVGARALGTLGELLLAEGAEVAAEGDLLSVTGLSAPRIAGIALEHRLVLHHLAARSASLEEAFMRLTGDSVRYSVGESR